MRELGLFLESDDVPYKPRAFEKAAYAVANAEQPVAQVLRGGGVRALDRIPSVGKGIAARIEEFVRTGKLEELERYHRRLPVDLLELTEVEGVGPKTARALFEALGVRNLADLAAAIEQHKLRTVPHFGDKREARLRRALEVHRAEHGRWPIGAVLPRVEVLIARLERVRGVQRVVAAGSIRRFRDTIGDIDLIAVSDDAELVMDAFAALPEVTHVYAKGPAKTLVRLSYGIDADLRVFDASAFGAALLYFTGSKAHNVKLRTLAQKRGLKLNEYGLFEGERLVAASDENSLYAALGLDFVPPELREDAGEIEAAHAGELPDLIGPGALRGDLHAHSTWTDGSASIEAMALTARGFGLEYLAITDHTRDLAMAGGLDEARIDAYVGDVRRAASAVEGIALLAGAEVNIRPDGSLDLPDAALQKLDFVGAAVHTHFDQSRDEATQRLLRVLEHPLVDALFHPGARALGRRPGLDADFQAVIAAAARTGTLLELDAQPDRLDLRDELVRSAVSAGALLVIDSDAHTPAELGLARSFGVPVARRGWAEATNVANTLSLPGFLARLKRSKRGVGGRRAP